MLEFLEDSDSGGTSLKCSKYSINIETKTAYPKTNEHIYKKLANMLLRKPKCKLYQVDLQGISFCGGASISASAWPKNPKAVSRC